MCVKNCEDSRAFLKKKLSVECDGWLDSQTAIQQNGKAVCRLW